MSQHRHPASAGSEQIVGKLHGALAVFRKERDDLFRSKELSNERLRLVVEERQAIEKTVNAMQGKLKKLNGKIQGKDESKNLETLQTEVERLDQEARFQHAELVAKRQKLDEYTSKLLGESKARSTILDTARESERKGRESRQSRMAASDKVSTMPQDLLQLVDHDILLQKLPRLVSEHTTSILDHTKGMVEQTNILLKRKQKLEEFVASFHTVASVTNPY